VPLRVSEGGCAITQDDSEKANTYERLTIGNDGGLILPGEGELKNIPLG
jgi:hypothetical protein